MSEFEEMISLHRLRVSNEISTVCDHLLQRANDHDNDKLDNKEIYEIYNEFFPELKKLKFGSDEYKKFEQAHFKNAHKLHAQNRHHYYSKYNQCDNINLFDILEAIIDIRQSQKQYSNYEIDAVMKTIINKGALNINLEDVVYNTLLQLEEFSNE